MAPTGLARKTRTPRTESVAAGPPAAADTGGDQTFVLHDVTWQGYVAMNDAFLEPPNVRMIYCDGRLTLLTESRKHGWYGERFGQLVAALADGLDLSWDDAGSATYRREEKRGGVEGDKTFYFGKNADRMSGPQNIDLTVQPPPDLAVEVEVSHSADDALTVWGRLGVPEVWRFDAVSFEFGFFARRRDGTYARRRRSRFFPALTENDVIQQMRSAQELGVKRWYRQLGNWVRTEIVPRAEKGRS